MDPLILFSATADTVTTQWLAYLGFGVFATAVLTWDSYKVWLIAAVGALLGRFVHYAVLARDGQFRWSWMLVWDVPISISTGICAAALAQGFGLEGNALIALAAVAGHLGPQFIKSVLEAFIKRK